MTSESGPLVLGIDTGGTFTDFVLFDSGAIRTYKCPSNALSPEQPFIEGIAALGLQPALRTGRLHIIHGTTVATNAALEGKGVRTLYVTNRGFEDTLLLARQARQSLYQLDPQPEVPLIDPACCIGVGARLDATGRELSALTDADLAEVSRAVTEQRADSVAINLLHSYTNDAHERRLEEHLERFVYVSRSSYVLPEIREYERGVATYFNAYLGPLVERYFRDLAERIKPSALSVMHSAAGTMAANQASKRAVNLLLSGPAGGLTASVWLGDLLNEPNLLTFDMGGTSTDVALLRGQVEVTNESTFGAWPLSVPMADIHTIGAGGGSIARVDSGGLLAVGPHSAGAQPGPACYGRGGVEATVSDANAVLGRLLPERFLNGRMALDIDSAQGAVGAVGAAQQLRAEEAAAGIIRIANEHMAHALRRVSLERGHDPREFALCCFGGAGGLHVCALADSLGIRSIIVPPMGGVFSAFGMVTASPSRELSRTLQVRLSGAAQRLMEAQLALEALGMSELAAAGTPSHEISIQASFDLRYEGQSYWLNIAAPDEAQDRSLAGSGRLEPNLTTRFSELHERRFGYRLDVPIEVVNVRVSVRGRAEQITAAERADGDGRPWARRDLPYLGDTAIYDRSALMIDQWLDGAALITEPYSTTLVAPSWQFCCTRNDVLRLRRIT